MRAALSKRIKRRDVVDGVMACWATTAGRTHTAAGDQSRGWRAPPMVEEADSGTPAAGPRTPPPRRRALARRRANLERAAALRPTRTVTRLT